ncbi:fimbrial protein [Citrobacter farmeri]|nr:fimbrial protein [Citrobacter farmeri]
MFIFKVEKAFHFLQKRIMKLLVIFFALLQILFIHHACASISGAHGLQYMSGAVICEDSRTALPQPGSEMMLRADYCNFDVDANNYVPASGNYKVRLYVVEDDNSAIWYADSKAVYIDQNKSMRDQNLSVGGGQGNVIIPSNYGYTAVDQCYTVVSEQGAIYRINMKNSVYCANIPEPPLPPTPPEPDIACVINNGNVLDVNLGTLDRAELPTVPTEGKTIPVSVNCTGGAVTVNMQLNYTPITVGATEIAKSDANGLGVAIMYNSKTLSTTDITPLNFVEGGNTFDLAFQAVRDPNVAEGDVPVGQFKASATLVLTQQ